jgi:predicted unusual protein kinase regulating ubiquinone biosynthesis (AarF/ABC1/UbiB family)
MALIKGLRKRHVDELDFRVEAAHLKEVSANMQVGAVGGYGCSP